jgi:hypothetical protein
MFAIWAVLSGFTEIQSMIDEIQSAISANADEVNPVQDSIA